MKKKLFPLLCMILSSAMLYAQTANSFQYKFPEKKNGPFNKLDVALTLGSTGVGIDVASPVTCIYSRSLLYLRTNYATI